MNSKKIAKSNFNIKNEYYIYNNMLSVDDIIKFLNLPKSKISNNIYRGNDSANLSKLPDNFATIHMAFKSFYYIKNNGNFYNTFLSLVDDKFISSFNQPDSIRELRKKLWESTDFAFKNFGYNRKRRFNKNQVQSELLNFSIDNPSEQICKYLIDFFGVNLYIISDSDPNNISVKHILATDDSDSNCVFKPCIICYEISGKYYPIIKNDHKTIFIFSKEDIVKDLYDRFVPKKYVKSPSPSKDSDFRDDVRDDDDDNNSKESKEPKIILKKSSDDIVEKEITTNHNGEKINETLKRPTTKMSLDELKELAKLYGISTEKKKGDKDISKTKKDLYDEIKAIANLKN